MVRYTQLAPISLTVNVAVALGAGTVRCSSIFLQADALNTNNVYWGATGVASNTGFTIKPGEKDSISFDIVYGNNTLISLGNIFLNSDTTGNLVRVGYWQVD